MTTRLRRSSSLLLEFVAGEPVPQHVVVHTDVRVSVTGVEGWSSRREGVPWSRERHHDFTLLAEYTRATGRSAGTDDSIRAAIG